MDTIWKDIKNYEGLYKISNHGDILGVKKNVVKKGFYKGKTKYRRIALSKNSIKIKFSIHRLVAQTFIENPNNLLYVNHKDGNKENNLVSNLEWCTISDNNKHAYTIGLKSAKGEKNGRAKLTWNKVDLIRKLFIESKNTKELSELFGISRSIIQRIVYNHLWVK